MDARPSTFVTPPPWTVQRRIFLVAWTCIGFHDVLGLIGQLGGEISFDMPSSQDYKWATGPEARPLSPMQQQRVAAGN